MTMPEKVHENTGRWKVPLAVAILVVLIAFALDIGWGNLPWSNLLSDPESAFNFAHHLFVEFFFVLAALLFLWGKALIGRWTLLLLPLAAAYGISITLGQFHAIDFYGPRRLANMVFLATIELTNPSYLIPAMILLASRFRGTWDRVRVATILLLLGQTIITTTNDLVVVPGYLYIYVPISVLLYAAAMVSLWCMAFQQVPADRTPFDNRNKVALTCPRCSKALILATGHDECPQCRLQIAITLEDGTCWKCRYSLRGLTGDRCPECGEVIASVTGEAQTLLSSEPLLPR